ncbi:MAG: endonuclease/exonuclease/phosphatase family protein [Rhodococcus sp.]|nr:endonuclease/exonuclease/phosphatase family protein [Rhodococcus sp. (in: high G+C Gram-positive bacteria)]
MIRKFFLAIAYIAVGVSVLGVVTHYVGPESNILILASSFVPLLVVVGVVGIVILLLARKWVIAAVATVVVAAAMATQAPLYVGSLDEPGEGTTLRVLQANIMLGESDAADLVQQISRRDVDILTIEELTDDAVQRLADEGIDQLLPEQFLVPKPDGGGGTGIYSKFPLSDEHLLPHFAMANLSATVEVSDSEQLALFAVHPRAPYPEPAWRWADEMERLREAVHSRAAQDPEVPVLVSGDFNSTYSHTRYRTFLTDGFDDVAERVGAGITPSYPANTWYPALVGIDRMIIRGLTVQEFNVVDLPGSDHHGLFAVFTTAGATEASNP